jgi:hypothetical protein
MVEQQELSEALRNLHTEKMPPKENTKTKGPVFANQKISIL